MKEQEAIAKTVVEWTKLAETGEDKPELVGVESDCYLCQYALEMKKPSETKYQICKYCPYHKKYGHCNGHCDRTGKPYYEWHYANTPADKRIHAAEFLAQVKTLQEKAMIDEELKHKLAQAKASESLLHAQVESLEHQIAEAEKPKLRQWDLIEWIGKDVTNKGVNLVLNKESNGEGFNQIRIRDGVKGTIQCITPNDKFIKHFNLADDLADMAEDLEGFEVNSKRTSGKIRVKLQSVDKYGATQPLGTTSETIVWLETDCGHFSLDEFAEILRKGRKGLATAIRKVK